MAAAVVVAVAGAGLHATPGAAARVSPGAPEAAIALATLRDQAECAADPNCAVAGSEQAFEDLFDYIVRIPDPVLEQGDAATKQYVSENPRDSDQIKTLRQSSLIKCIGAVALVVGTIAVPAAKLLKIKQLIEKIGGVVNAARGIVKGNPSPAAAPGRADPSRLGPPAAGENVSVGDALIILGTELLGIDTIAQNCF